MNKNNTHLASLSHSHQLLSPLFSFVHSYFSPFTTLLLPPSQQFQLLSFKALLNSCKAHCARLFAYQIGKQEKQIDSKLEIPIAKYYDKHRLSSVFNLNDSHWQELSECMSGRSALDCRLKTYELIQNKLIQNKWTPNQNEILRELVQNQRQQVNWRIISLKLFDMNQSDQKVYRSSRQCKENYMNNLDKNLKKGDWQPLQDSIILNYYKKYGRTDRQLTSRLQRRCQVDIKNRLRSLLKRGGGGEEYQYWTRQENYLPVTLERCPNSNIVV